MNPLTNLLAPLSPPLQDIVIECLGDKGILDFAEQEYSNLDTLVDVDKRESVAKNKGLIQTIEKILFEPHLPLPSTFSWTKFLIHNKSVIKKILARNCTSFTQSFCFSFNSTLASAGSISKTFTSTLRVFCKIPERELVRVKTWETITLFVDENKRLVAKGKEATFPEETMELDTAELKSKSNQELVAFFSTSEVRFLHHLTPSKIAISQKAS